MATSIVIELQQLASDSKASVTDILRKALIVATKLKIQDFKEWVENEMGGYRGSAGNDMPKYRKVYLNRHKNCNGKLIPTNAYPFDWIRDSVSELQELLSADKGIFLCRSCLDHVVFVPYDSIQSHSDEQANENVNILERSQIVGILNQVRDFVLKWALKLEEQGIMGDGMSFSDVEKRAATNNPSIHIGQYIEQVVGQNRNYNDSTDNSVNTVNVNAAAFDALRQACGDIADERTRTEAVEKINALEKATDKPSALAKVGVVAALASHSINIANAIALNLPTIMAWVVLLRQTS